MQILAKIGGFLGQIESSIDIEVDIIKTEAIQYCPRPLVPTDIQCFFRLDGYYKRFVDEFASIASLFTTITENFLDSFVIVFIGDILVYSKSEDEQLSHWRIVLQILKEHQLIPMYGKCKFWLRSVVFLGQIESSMDIEVDIIKTEPIQYCPRPLAPTDIQSFFRLDG